MKSESPLQEATDIDYSVNLMDRQIIRVDMPSTSAGIAAALRQAFEPVSMSPCDRDFGELLRKLN